MPVDTKPMRSGIIINEEEKCFEVFIIFGDIKTEEEAHEYAKYLFDMFSSKENIIN